MDTLPQVLGSSAAITVQFELLHQFLLAVIVVCRQLVSNFITPPRLNWATHVSRTGDDHDYIFRLVVLLIISASTMDRQVIEHAVPFVNQPQFGVRWVHNEPEENVSGT